MRLIDADALIKIVNNRKVVGRFNTIKLIEEAPTIEPQVDYSSVNVYVDYTQSAGHVVPDTLQGWRYEQQPTGNWVGDTSYESYQGYYEAYKCSNCGFEAHWRDCNEYNFCPKCGAKMK